MGGAGAWMRCSHWKKAKLKGDLRTGSSSKSLKVKEGCFHPSDCVCIVGQGYGKTGLHLASRD